MSSRPMRSRRRKCWSMTRSGAKPSPWAICTSRRRGVPPLSPIEIMCRERTAAPALVPATTIPAACRRRRVAAIAVPPRAEEMRSWLPPVMKNPVATSRAS